MAVRQRWSQQPPRRIRRCLTKAVRGLSLLALMLALAPTPLAATPMRVALLVDTSAATSGAIAQLRAAVTAFLDALAPEHEALLVTTGRRVQVRVPPTLDRVKLKGGAGGLLSDGGPTALIDALTEVDQRFMRKSGDRWPVLPDLIASTLVKATQGHYKAMGTGGGLMSALTQLAGWLAEDGARRR
jgi:hypothetical protein